MAGVDGSCEAGEGAGFCAGSRVVRKGTSAATMRIGMELDMEMGTQYR